MVRISAGCESSESKRSSQAVNTAMEMGIASDLSNGMRVFDFKKSETVWLCNAERIARSTLRAIHRRALMCVVILVLDGWGSVSSSSSLRHEGSPVPKIVVLPLEGTATPACPMMPDL